LNLPYFKLEIKTATEPSPTAPSTSARPVAQPAVRETFEESGIECTITGIAGIYSAPKHVIPCTSDGEARQEFSIVLTARPLSGQPTPGGESSEVPPGPGVWTPRLHDGPINADPHQRLPVTQRVTGDHLAPDDRGPKIVT